MKVRRVPYFDEYAEGGESAVLIGDRVLVLSPLATSLLEAIGEETVEVDHIAGVLGELYGEPPDGVDLHAATALAVQTLADQGLVEMSD